MYSELEKKLCMIGVLWKHRGKTEKSHAILASGKHSNGFLNLSILSSHPRILREFTDILAGEIRDNPEFEFFLKNPQLCWLIGSAMGGIPVALQLAEKLNFKMAYAEKTPEGKMTFKRYISEVSKIDNVVLTEDVLTTGSTTQKTINTLVDAGLGNAIFNSIVLIINRTGKKEIKFNVDGKEKNFKLVSAISLDFDVWQESECPLCKAGSIGKKPKNNWAEFSCDSAEFQKAQA